MIYRVVHTTEYTYAEPVSLCQNLLHLRPRDTPTQKVLDSAIRVSPEPSVTQERMDVFGNGVTYVAVQEPHSKLNVTARSRVEVTPREISESARQLPWEAARGDRLNARRQDEREGLAMTFASGMVPVDEKLADYARLSFAPGRPLFFAALDLTERINREFKFDPKATQVGTPVLEVLQKRRGVCQDFAQLQIGCLRSIGLPARYVSGYLLTRPAPGQKKLVGADVSHAWVSVFFPGYGWIDFDPTNAVVPTDKHVTVAWARDYEDITPLKGVMLGGRRHTLRVSVDVSTMLRRPPVSDGTRRATLVPSPGTPAEG